MGKSDVSTWFKTWGYGCDAKPRNLILPLDHERNRWGRNDNEERHVAEAALGPSGAYQCRKGLAGSCGHRDRAVLRLRAGLPRFNGFTLMSVAPGSPF